MSNADHRMSPESSPNINPKRQGVRRVNNMPVFIFLGVLTAFLLVMALVAVDRSRRTAAEAEPLEGNHDSALMFARELVADDPRGLVPVAEPAAEAPPLAEPLAPATLDIPAALSPAPGSYPERQDDDEAGRMRSARMLLLEAAALARTQVNFAASGWGAVPERPSAARTPDNGVASLAEARNLIERVAGTGLSSMPGAGPAGHPGATEARSVAAAPGSGHAAFGRAGQQDRWRLDALPEPPRSAYELRAGFVIPAILVSGINSDLPGQIVAQVAQDVYDTATGNWLLIPQGARLVGTYSSDVAYGQSRVLVAWQRIVFPDGKAMDIDAMPGADGEGHSGFKDRVNRHYARLFGSAFLMSGVTAGITYSQRRTQAPGLNNATDAGTVLSEALGQQLGQVTAQLIARNMNISPTLEIRPGYRFNVVATKDMTFPGPYRPFDYQRKG